jgi:membrane protease YdiL (CAAX protease family)
VDFLRNLLFNRNEMRPRSGWRIIAHFLLLLVLLPLTDILLFGITSLSPLLTFLAEPWIISAIAVTLSIYLARRWYDRRSFASLGLERDEHANRDLVAGILIAGAVMGAIFLAEWALGWLTIEGWAADASGAGLAANLGYWVAIFILVGWYEELLSRGYWLQNLEDGLGTRWAVLISSTVFGLGHLGNPNASWVAVLGIVGAGLFLAFGYLRTRQLWLPIGLHIGWNIFQGPVFSFPVSGIETAKLIEHSVNGPQIITGGAFGPEAGLIVLPAMALGAALIYWYTARVARRAEKRSQ